MRRGLLLAGLAAKGRWIWFRHRDRGGLFVPGAAVGETMEMLVVRGLLGTLPGRSMRVGARSLRARCRCSDDRCGSVQGPFGHAAAAKMIDVVPCGPSAPAAADETMEVVPCGRSAPAAADETIEVVPCGPSAPAAADETIDVVPCSPPSGAGASYYRGFEFRSVGSLGKMRARSIRP